MRAESRTQTAFRWSVLELFNRGRQVYFWTFTMVEAVPSWMFGPTWHRALVALRDYYGPLRGVRVFEWHKRHGLHSHALIDERLNINVVRRKIRPFGFGVTHVEKADLGGGLYLAKYLDKDRGKIPYSGRSWARLGGAGVRVNQVRFESARSTWIRARIKALRIEGVETWAALQAAREEFDRAWYASALVELERRESVSGGFAMVRNEGDPF